MASAAIWALAAAWLAWSALNAWIMLWIQRDPLALGYDAAAVGLIRPRVVVSERARSMFTAEEYEAVCLHERGHIASGHLWKNFALAVLLPFYRSAMLAIEQEVEADNYALERGRGAELASALRKVSDNEFDLWRASRLEGMAGETPGTQARGTRAASNIREG